MKRFVHEKPQDSGHAMTIRTDCADIHELKNPDQDNVNEVVIYCRQYPDSFNFQIRTHKGIGEFNEGKERDMIATVSVNINEMEQILAFMKDRVNR